MRIQHLSPSLLNHYDSCPLAFKYSFEHLPEVEIDDSKMEFGTETHSQIATYLRALRNDITEKESEGLAKQTFGETSRYVGQSTKATIVRNFLDFEKQRRAQFKAIRPDLVETKLYATLYPDLLPFATIVDAYWREDQTCINWKTGSSTELEDSGVLQGTIETLVLRANNHPVQHHWFVYLGNNRIFETPLADDSWLKTRASRLLDSVRLGYFPKRSSGLCRSYCLYLLKCSFEGKCLWNL